MKELKSLKLTPPGGWRYQDPTTKYKFRKLYNTFEELVAHVALYREQNKLPKIPDLHLVIQDWLCSQPGMLRVCKQSTTAPSRTLKQYLAGAKAAARVRFGKEGEVFASAKEAEARAEVCINCRHNKKRDKDAKLERYTDGYVSKLVGERKTSLDDKLFSCEICSCPLRPKVHISQKIVEDSLNSKERKLLAMDLWGLDGRPFKCWQIEGVDLGAKEK